MPSELVELKGHIIDSLSLPRVLDSILAQGGEFEILEMTVGKTRDDQSRALIRIQAPNDDKLNAVLAYIEQEGANRLEQQDAELVPAPKDGVFPEHFYCTTNLPTSVKVSGKWIPVDRVEMDCGIVIENGQARTTPMNDVRAGQMVVVGHDGIKVETPERRESVGTFEFMTSTVSSEKPKALMVAEVARQIRDTKKAGKKVLLVGGPAIVHAGAGEAVARMIRDGWIDVIFAGNALATHDIESALYGTALGVYIEEGKPAPHGHENHLRAINEIRRVGSIAEAVKQGVLTKGIMYEAVKAGVSYVLAGSIRDDGPLPDVITDVMEAQDAMRAQLSEVGMALMVATTLHSVATGNLLPASVEVVCVDINTAVVTKLADRGTHQAVGVVTDAALFMSELADELKEAGPWRAS
ncbi:MAG TPA: TIGR00300 family protein [Armatimonadota bacterium]|nr:TIGR00300 family protein [Armatimonadota bacterium]HPP74338.1 TIGR00300 family protein [Armatimonadota bacterium]